jgi:hypothetical protein
MGIHVKCPLFMSDFKVLICRQTLVKVPNIKFHEKSVQPKIAIFWVVATCSLVEVHQSFGATIQKTAIFIVAAVRNSNPTIFSTVLEL